MSTGGDERDEFTEDWFEDAGEPGGFRDPDAETWLEEPAPPAGPRDRRPLIGALAAAVALIVIGVGIARVVGGDDDETTPTAPGTTAITEPATTAETTTTPTTTAPTITLPSDVTLRRGDEGDNVQLLQEALVALGYDIGEPDGSYGPATEEAVRQFQADSGLEADGIAGPTTLAAMNDALAAAG